nr:restriction endonuclease subunit S [Endozoicomonas sp. SCSIO W0465]
MKEANVSQHVTIIRLLESEMTSFVHTALLSPMVQSLVWGRQVGMAIEGLSKKVLECFEFPVPPLEEQHRITAKVNQLMTLCDQIKTHLQHQKQTRLHLADAMVHKALS